MGLIKAALGAFNGTMADQWKEFFYCEALDKTILVKRGSKQITGRSSNTKGNDNIITNGSGIAVADGQCMIIVDQGKIVEFCAEPGEYTYNISTEPSLFCGSLGEGLKNTFKIVGKRFTYGGDTGKDQRVYYFNTKEIVDNKFGSANPIPFRVVDRNIGLDIDVSIRCNGVYSYKITNPLLFYANVCGNVSHTYERSEIDSQLKTEFISALQPALAKISELEIRPNAIPAHVDELSDAVNEKLMKKWGEIRGLSVISIAMNSVTLPDEDAQLIKQAQKNAIMRDPTMAAATLVGAQADAMKSAAANPSGAMNGFVGMGFAQNAGSMNAQNLYAMGQQNSQQTQPQANALWTCACGNQNSGKFCPHCGKPKPADGWSCSCGTMNKGRFCSECGKEKPAGELLYKCDKCGWEPEDPSNPPKFCPECGDKFGSEDIISK
ncbi:MAG: SPFH domain-containing protein [Eubacterium sp.]|nr:SPFH domain-containing protein [Eubacterium sp.]